MDITAGYVYILINPSMGGIVKIGRTQNNPEERAKELSSATGVPTPFFVAYSSYFKDCNRAEIFVHTLLENSRYADNREFFQVSLQKAIDAIRQAESTLEVATPEPGINTSLENDETSAKPLALWVSVFRSANGYFSGLGDTIQDQGKALQIYLKCAKLGSISAYWIIGIMHLSGLGCEQDREKAKGFFFQGTNVGNDLCWAGLGIIFFGENNLENWNKAWKKYFTSAFFVEDKNFEELNEVNVGYLTSRKEYLMCNYVDEAIWANWEMKYKDIIFESRNEIFDFIDWYRTKSGENDAYEQVREIIITWIKEHLRL
jgi:hypothetical protein